MKDKQRRTIEFTITQSSGCAEGRNSKSSIITSSNARTRYVLFSKLSEVHQKLLDCGLRVDSSVPDDETKPSYNISPSTFE